MRERLDADSPTPLYWQVAEALRYRVATGELTPGQRLPSLREAAEEWGINMHTVRRAYAELSDRGIVAVRPRSGTVVLDLPEESGTSAGDSARSGAAGIEGWLREVAREGRERWGLAADELAAAVAQLPPPGASTEPVVVVECSETQAADLARQLEARWRVAAAPWSLDREGEPPWDALVVGTYFHYNDIRVRWPRRFPEVRFLATRPDPSIAERLARIRAEGEGPLAVRLWERDEAMGRNIAADLLRSLPEDGFTVRHRVGGPGELPDATSGAVLFSPRTWAELPEDARRRDGFMEVRYVFEQEDLRNLARELEWERR